ncbi:MAG: c-type cytochrome [Daejeonella sp.]
MKKPLFILSLALAMFAACTQNNKSETAESDSDTTEFGELKSASAQQSSVDTNLNKIGTDPTPTGAATGSSNNGEMLISKSDCMGCHKVNEKLVGPAYQEIAAKYEATEANKNLLANKIVNGGSGVWGEIPMAPHPSISQGDAKEMVSYILSLKSK